jgi:hypothetical protein
MNQTQRSDGILDPGIIYSPAPPRKKKKKPHIIKANSLQMRDMKPYKSKEKRVLSSLSTSIQQPASLVNVQTMLLLKKKTTSRLSRTTKSQSLSL